MASLSRDDCNAEADVEVMIVGVIGGLFAGYGGTTLCNNAVCMDSVHKWR